MKAIVIILTVLLVTLSINFSQNCSLLSTDDACGGPYDINVPYGPDTGRNYDGTISPGGRDIGGIGSTGDNVDKYLKEFRAECSISTSQKEKLNRLYSEIEFKLFDDRQQLNDFKYNVPLLCPRKKLNYVTEVANSLGIAQ